MRLGTYWVCSLAFWLIDSSVGQRTAGLRSRTNIDDPNQQLLRDPPAQHDNVDRQLRWPHNNHWKHNRRGVPRGDHLQDFRNRGTLPHTTQLSVELTGPGAAFANQKVTLTTTTTNTGDFHANNVQVVFTLPMEATFVSSTPSGTLNGHALVVPLASLAPEESHVITLELETPSTETVLQVQAQANADNASSVSDSEQVEVGVVTVVTGGVTSAGVGLRNRSSGTIRIDVPDSATVTRAVLVWAILYDSSLPVPSNEISLNGSTVTADLTATVSQSLCWEDDETIGYAADVTTLVSGSGDYVISDAVNGVYRVDSDPFGQLPYTDGASLFVFYGGQGFDNQVVSDFTYSAVTGDSGVGYNTRTLTDINSTGGKATLHIAGPDGQNTGSEQLTITVTGQDILAFADSWEGSAPQDGPDFAIGNLWDNDILDVSSVLPAGQRTLEVKLGPGFVDENVPGVSLDCVGVSAVALEVEQ